MIDGIVVFHPKHLPSSGDGFAAWIYADENPEIHERVRDRFAPLAPAIAPRRFQDEAAVRRSDFVAWTDANLSGHPVEEWLSTPLHRCTFPSPAPPIFLHTVWLSLIAGLLRGEGGTLAVVTCHRGLAMAISEIADRTGTPFRVVGSGTLRAEAMRIRLRALAALGKSVLDLSLRILLARIFLGNAHLERLRSTEVLIDTYLHGTDLSATGAFQDRYFPGLAQWYLARGIKAAMYPFLFRVRFRDLPGVYRAISRSDIPMAPFERFVGPLDLLWALGQSINRATMRRSGCSPLDGIDMSPLLPIPGFVAATSAFMPLLMLRAPERMGRRGIRPACVLDWHEDQPIDKATAYGFLHTSEPTRVIGMRQYIPVPNYLSEYSTPAELAGGLAPVEHWVCGPALPRLLDAYASGTRYRVVPALRFAHLFEEAPAGADKSDLLILLTHSVSESVQILALALESLDKCHNFVRIVVKPQPNVPKTAAAIRSMAERRWPQLLRAEQVVWSSEPMPQLLARARLVVSSGTSAALESVCRGVPVIMVGNVSGLDAVPLAYVDERIWRLVYDRNEFLAALASLIDETLLPTSVCAEIANRTRSEYFMPTTESTMREFECSAG